MTSTPEAPIVDIHGDEALGHSGLVSRAVGAARVAGKAVFAATDVFLGSWPGPRVLIYHQIGAGSGRQMDLAPALFRRHVDWLQSQGKIVGLGDALSGADDRESHLDFVLTFDDGYADFYENAFPVLAERRLPFTLYLTTEHIESGECLHEGDRPLNWDMVREMVDTGLVTMGAHTHTHPDLRGMSTTDVEREVKLSNGLIESRTGIEARHFAYPKGYWDPRAESVLRRHYDTAVLGAGAPVTGSTDPYRVHRVAVQAADRYFFFRRKLTRGMRLEERVRMLMKGYDHPPV
jgi:peptidoglycan/xylan/chitin deacetylase (PgdA/CDA1 family)